MKERVVCWCGFFRRGELRAYLQVMMPPAMRKQQLRSVGCSVSLPSGVCVLTDPCCFSKAATAEGKHKRKAWHYWCNAGENSFSFRGLSKMQLLVQPLELNGSWRCHCGGGSHLCPPSGQYLIPITSPLFHLKY